MNQREQIRDIFERELAAWKADHEPSGYIRWLENLRDEILSILDESPPAKSQDRALENHESQQSRRHP